MNTDGTRGEAFGPPLIGALLRMPWESVQRHMAPMHPPPGTPAMPPAPQGKQ